MIVSIDPGIKNLAVCSMKKQDENVFRVVDWRIANLVPESNPGECTAQNCARKARFFHEQKGYCGIHSKKAGLPFAPLDFGKLRDGKRISKKRSAELCKIYECEDIGDVYQRIEEQCLLPGREVKVTSVPEIVLCKALKTELDAICRLEPVSTVLIENQMGPRAVRMRSIQAMISMYFQCRGENVEIKYISPKRKLSSSEGAKATYAERKALGISIVEDAIRDCGRLSKIFTEHGKQDDLADAFLQAKWFLEDQMAMPIAFS